MSALAEMQVQPASLLFSVDEDRISVRAGGQRHYDLDRREFCDAPDLTAGQAKQRAREEWGDVRFCDLRVRRVHLRFDPDAVDEESVTPGAWVMCEPGDPGAERYFQVSRPA